MKRSSSRILALAPVVLLAAFGLGVMLTSPSPRLVPALHLAAPTLSHLFGCGEGGVDLFVTLASALLGGLTLAILVSVFSFVIGVPLGAWASMRSGLAEKIVFRVADVLQAMPTFLLALTVLSAVKTPSRLHLALVLLLTSWASFARLAMAETRVLRGAAYVEAARALGESPFAVLRRHVIPALLPMASVQMGATASAVILSEAALGFLGFESRSTPTLGGILAEGVASMMVAPHVLLVGAASVFLASVALLIAGTTISPKLR